MGRGGPRLHFRARHRAERDVHQPPAFDALAEEFLRNYHRYADCLYRCFMDSQPHRAAVSARFQFDLYASGEYSRRLESEWAE